MTDIGYGLYRAKANLTTRIHLYGNPVNQALAICGCYDPSCPETDECYICPMKPADDEFISSIASNVMGCLAKSSYFQKLDDLLSPEDSSGASENCDGTYRLSESILQKSGFERDDLSDIFAVLQSKGACCDCEVLYNVAEKSRLKAKYWRSRASGQPTNITHQPHSRS